MRDDFPKAVKNALAHRVNFLCSNPECPLGTVGPHTDDDSFVNKGVAAHISAASAGGKRYDNALTPEERSSATNGIWLCQNCAKLIDSDEQRYTAALLRDWKAAAEAGVQKSLESNSALTMNGNGPDVRVSASYAGGQNNSNVHISIFNASPSPIFLAAWFASFEGNARPGSMSYVHRKGRFPIRLQGQDRCAIVVDITDHPVKHLQQLGIVDGNGRHWQASDTQIATIVQKSERYSRLQPRPDPKDVEQAEVRLKNGDVAINVVIEDLPSGHKRLKVVFKNKSAYPIELRAAEIKWQYDPPRWQPSPSDSKMKIAESGGSVRLVPTSDLKSSVVPGQASEFILDDGFRHVLVETILGDVKDEGIQVAVYSSTRIMWTAIEDEIPEAVREFARYVVQKTQSKSQS